MWKRIEDEMPADNTPVLCFGRDRFSPNATAMAVMEWCPRPYSFWSVVGATGHDVEESVIPTHWQPLPAQP